jgi:hypothetical protein
MADGRLVGSLYVYIRDIKLAPVVLRGKTSVGIMHDTATCSK